MNTSTTVLDCSNFLEYMISMIDHNWENPTFYPTIDHLKEFKNKLAEVA